MYNRFTIHRHDLKANEINVHSEWHDQCARYVTTFPTLRRSLMENEIETTPLCRSMPTDRLNLQYDLCTASF